MLGSPGIVVQPLSQTAPAGTRVSFSVVAAGDGQLHYQWRKSSVDLAGQTSASFTIDNVMSADAGDYAVLVSDSGGATNSVAARLTVGSLQQPAITTQPPAQSVSAGSSVTLQITATGSGPLSFQWQKNGFALAGQTSATLALQAVTSADAGNYSVIVSNAAGLATSANAALTVTTPSSPVILLQPLDQTVAAGAPVAFNVNATGSGQLQFQWKKNGVALAGQTTATLTIGSATALDAGDYTVAVSNATGSTNSLGATLTVASGVPPAIKVQPGNQTVATSGRASFTVVATGSAPLSFQWRKNGVNISGQTGATLVLNNVTTADMGDYSVAVTNSAGSQISANGTLTVTGPAMQPPFIIIQPVSQTVASGARVTLSATATGSGPLQYQWMHNGVDLTGQTASSLTISTASAADAGDYSVMVSSAAGATNSALARLTIGGSGAPTITSGPVDQHTGAGGTATFTVQAQGTAPLSFQWKTNGVNIAGATSSTLVVSNVQAASAGKYQVVVSNSDGAAASAEAALNIIIQISAGTVDSSFAAGSVSNVLAMAVQADRKVIIGGGFTNVAGTVRNHIARLNADGSLDTSFAAGAGANGDVLDLKLQGDGKVIVGGTFTNLQGGTARRIGRLDANGSLDATFDAGAGVNGGVSTVKLQADGKVLIAGDFDTVNGSARRAVARLNADGSVDTAFNAGIGSNGEVHDLDIQTDGKIIVGGSFSTVQGSARGNVARLNADGSLDASFGSGLFSGTAGTVNEVEIQSDGKILLAGSFTLVNGSPRLQLARLNADGSLDTSFEAGLSGLANISSVRIETNGKILVSGQLDFLGIGILPDLAARLNANGSLEAGLAGGTDTHGAVTTMEIQADGNVLIATDSGIFRVLGDLLIQGPRILTILKSTNSVNLAVQTRVGKTYTLETQTTITASNWNELSTQVGDGSVKTFTDASATGTARFYRIREQ